MAEGEPPGSLAVIEDAVAVVEGAALYILAAQPYGIGSQVQPRCRISVFACTHQHLEEK